MSLTMKNLRNFVASVSPQKKAENMLNYLKNHYFCTVKISLA
jgi:hypothetical protein